MNGWSHARQRAMMPTIACLPPQPELTNFQSLWTRIRTNPAIMRAIPIRLAPRWIWDINGDSDFLIESSYMEPDEETSRLHSWPRGSQDSGENDSDRDHGHPRYSHKDSMENDKRHFRSRTVSSIQISQKTCRRYESVRVAVVAEASCVGISFRNEKSVLLGRIIFEDLEMGTFETRLFGDCLPLH